MLRKKKIKGNTRNQKYSNRNEECLCGLIRILFVAKERISELKDMPMKHPKPKCKEKKRMKTKKQQNIQGL